MRARLLGTSPSRSAFACKVSECVCLIEQGTCTCSLRRPVDSPGLPRARLCNDPAACRGAGPAAEVIGALAPPAHRPQASKSLA